MTPPPDRVIAVLRHRSIVRGMADADGGTPEPEMDAVGAKEGAGPIERYRAIWGGLLLLVLEEPLELLLLTEPEGRETIKELDACGARPMLEWTILRGAAAEMAMGRTTMVRVGSLARRSAPALQSLPEMVWVEEELAGCNEGG